VRFGLQFALKPTPIVIKRVSDAINGALGASGLISVVSGYPKASIALTALGFVLKAASNLFSIDQPVEPKK
jgi:hypothetical protein